MTAGISLFSQYDSLQRMSNQLQKSVAEATIESGSTKKYNLAADLDSSLRPYLDLAGQYALNTGRTDLVSLGASRIDMMANAVSQVQVQVKSLLDTAASGLSGPNAQDAYLTSTEGQGSASLDGIASALQTQFGSRFLFSGDAVGTSPLSTITALTTAVKKAIDDQATADGGTVSNFTTLYSKIDSIFDDTHTDATQRFTALVYKGGTGSAPPLRLSDTQTVQYDMRADDTVFRNVLKGAAMYAAMGELRKTNSVADTVAYSQHTYGQLRASNDALTDTIAVWGTKQKYVSDQIDNMKLQTDAISQRISDYEGVDMFAVSTQLANYKTQLQAMYQITGIMNQLSLLNYLR